MRAEVLHDGGRADDSLSTDRILELIGQYQRRAIIRRLRDAPGRDHSIDDVVEFLEDVERQRDGEVPGEDHLLSLLVHIHGPKLEAAGLIDYDVPEREIHYYPDERVEGLLDRIEEWADES